MPYSTSLCYPKKRCRWNSLRNTGVRNRYFQRTPNSVHLQGPVRASVFSPDKTLQEHHHSTLRSYIRLMRQTSETDAMATACLTAGFLLQFHRETVDNVGLAMGLNRRPIYVIDSSCHTAQVSSQK